MKRMNKEQIHFEHYRGNEDFVKRVYDQIDLAHKRNRIVITPFFTPDRIAIVEAICGNQIQYVKDGGYENAECCRFAFLPYPCKVFFPTIVLKARIASSFSSITHRDVLGALMHVGIQRDKIGDIIVKQDVVYIIVDQDIAPYLIGNVTRISHVQITLEQCEETILHAPKMDWSLRIIASLRLDVVVASVAKLSRAKAQGLIVSGSVKVNHVVLEQTSYLCNNNSAISIRGYGRYHFAEIVKKTKKDHFVVRIGAYV